jgi:hypothetical protein
MNATRPSFVGSGDALDATGLQHIGLGRVITDRPPYSLSGKPYVERTSPNDRA